MKLAECGYETSKPGYESSGYERTMGTKRLDTHFSNVYDNRTSYEYSGIPISQTSRGNAIWFEKSGVREIEGGIKLRLIGRVLFDYE